MCATGRVEGVVEGEVLRFMKWCDSFNIVPLVKTLRQQAEDTSILALARAITSTVSSYFRGVAKFETRLTALLDLHGSVLLD